MKLKIAVALALTVAASHVPAADLQDVYFAYSAKQFGQAVQYTLLSHEPCADPRGKKLGWARAAFTTAGTNLLPGCWQDVSSAKLGGAVRVCLVGSDNKVGNACLYISKEYFSDTATLPRRPKF